MLLVRLVAVTGRPPSGSAVAKALPALLAAVRGRVPVVAGRDDAVPGRDDDVPGRDDDDPGRDIIISTGQAQHTAGG